MTVIKKAREKIINSVKGYFKRLNNKFPDFTPKFEKIARENGFSAIPTIEIISKKGNHLNSYYIGYQKVNFDSNHKEDANSNESKKVSDDGKNQDIFKINEIEYISEEVKLKFFNWRYNYELSGVRLIRDFILLMSTFLIIVFTVFYLFPYNIKNIFSSFEGLKNTYLIVLSTYILIILPVKNK